MKFELEKIYRNVPDDEIIADIKRVASELGQDFLTMSQYGKYGKFDNSTPKRRFGSRSKATALAGLGKAKIQQNARLSDEKLFKNLEEAWTKLGRQPRISEMVSPISAYSAAVYKRHFGSWMKALEIFVDYINADKTEDEAISNVENETTSVDEVSGRVFKHKTRRGISDRLRFRILMRDGFTCQKCGRSPLKERDVELHVDHIIPWSKGGETLSENLETKCSRCNLGKGNAFNE